MVKAFIVPQACSYKAEVCNLQLLKDLPTPRKVDIELQEASYIAVNDSKVFVSSVLHKKKWYLITNGLLSFVGTPRQFGV